MTFLSQQAECDCGEEKTEKGGEVEGGSVYGKRQRGRDRERERDLKWSSS